MGAAGLFEACSGHCGTFNHALVHALRARGSPARVIAGVSTGFGSHMISEVWCGDGLGWVPADATRGGVHMDFSFPGWQWLARSPGEQGGGEQGAGENGAGEQGAGEEGAGGESFFAGWHCMDASEADSSDSSRLLGGAWRPKDEVERIAFWEGRFEMMDCNGDGALSMTEMLETLEALEPGVTAFARANQDGLAAAAAHKLAALSELWDVNSERMVCGGLEAASPLKPPLFSQRGASRLRARQSSCASSFVHTLTGCALLGAPLSLAPQVSKAEYVEAMSAIDRKWRATSETKESGGERSVSAGFGYDGVALYLAGSGQRVPCETYPTPAFVQLARRASGQDISPKARDAGNSEKHYPLFWVRQTCS